MRIDTDNNGYILLYISRMEDLIYNGAYVYAVTDLLDMVRKDVGYHVMTH